MAQQNPFQQVFDELRDILKKYEEYLLLKEDTAESYYLNTPYVEEYEKELFFGAAQVKKNYVSYHLMPVYMYPDLLTDLPPLLEERMHGKSCFNFKTISPKLLKELSLLTRKSFERLKEEGIIESAA